MNPQMDRRKDLSMNQEKSTNLSNIQTQKIKEDIVNRIQNKQNGQRQKKS